MKTVRSNFLSWCWSLIGACWTAIAALNPSIASADDSTGLLGDWGGSKLWLDSYGIAADASLTSEFVANLRGGEQRGSDQVHALELELSAESERAGLWQDGLARLHFTGAVGGDPSNLAGSTQLPTSSEGDEQVHLYEGWIRQKLFDRRLQILIGYRDYSSEFDQIESAEFLLNNSFGTDPVTSQTGPSLATMAPFAARVAVFPTDSILVQCATFLGSIGGDQHEGSKVVPSLSDHERFAAEASVFNYNSAAERKDTNIVLGGWLDNASSDSLEGAQKSSDAGAYVFAEKVFFQSNVDPDRYSSAFLQLSSGDQERNEIGGYIGGGLKADGVFTTTFENTVSLGVARAYPSNAFKRLVPDSTPFETVYELTFKAGVGSDVSIQPDLQLIMNPGMDPELKSALVAIVRIELSL